jgi:hypothetical protein
VLNSCLNDQTTQSKIVLKCASSREYNSPKLYFIRAFRNAKKLALIYGNELKSVVMRGRLLAKIMSRRFDRKVESITECSF